MLGDQILHFLEFFYYLLSHFENRRSGGPEIFTVFYCSHQNSNFQKCLINSKKNPKNVKFGLQAHFNMDYTSNVQIGRLNIRNAKMSYKHMWGYAYISIVANLYIYRERERWAMVHCNAWAPLCIGP